VVFIFQLPMMYLVFISSFYHPNHPNITLISLEWIALLECNFPPSAGLRHRRESDYSCDLRVLLPYYIPYHFSVGNCNHQQNQQTKTYGM
jgi:hypothetical protein